MEYGKVWYFVLFYCLLSLAIGQRTWSLRRTRSCSCGTFYQDKLHLVRTLCEKQELNKLQFRIVGGLRLTSQVFPFMAALQKDTGKLFCGGTIITTSHVLTAAHCKVNKTVYVRVGVHNLKSLRGMKYLAEKFIIHEGFNKETMENDIAIVVTQERIALSRSVQPACLPMPSQLPLNTTGQNVITLGWGRTKMLGKEKNILRAVCLPVVDFAGCLKTYNETSKPLTPSRSGMSFCTYTKGRDSCKGDSGGPLIWLDKKTKKFLLVGVVSFGEFCGGALPGVNTNVTHFSEWIIKKISQTRKGTHACSAKRNHWKTPWWI